MVPAGGAINEMVLAPPQPVAVPNQVINHAASYLSVMENKPGALMRVTGLLSARGYNIESLTVARTLDPELSRMTIAVDVDAMLRQQVIKQMNKLVNVLQAADLSESPAVSREMVLRARAHPAGQPHGGPQGSRNLRRARVDSSVEGFAHRSHRRSGKARRVHRCHAQLWRDRSLPAPAW